MFAFAFHAPQAVCKGISSMILHDEMVTVWLASVQIWSGKVEANSER